MTWLYADERTIVHTSGFSITLLQGTWRDPYGINPRESSPLSDSEMVKLIRDGLSFAKINDYDVSVDPEPESAEQCDLLYRTRFAAA